MKSRTRPSIGFALRAAGNEIAKRSVPAVRARATSIPHPTKTSNRTDPKTTHELRCMTPLLADCSLAEGFYATACDASRVEWRSDVHQARAHLVARRSVERDGRGTAAG